MARKKITKLKISYAPQNIKDSAWYYEYPKSIEVIAECRHMDGAYHQTLVIRIPARKLLASLIRMGLVKKKVRTPNGG